MYEFVITCDGGSLGNGSENAIGYGSFMIAEEGKVNEIHQLHFGEGVTNNEAEYLALIGALDYLAGAFTAVAADLKTISITIRTDSQLVIGQLSMGWKVKAPNLRPLAIKAAAKSQQFKDIVFKRISGVQMKKILGH